MLVTPARQRLTTMDLCEVSHLRSAFDLIDSDHDGRISRQDLRIYVKSLGQTALLETKAVQDRVEEIFCQTASAPTSRRSSGLRASGLGTENDRKIGAESKSESEGASQRSWTLQRRSTLAHPETHTEETRDSRFTTAHITFEQFRVSMSQELKKLDGLESEILRTFRIFDLDGDGYITSAELKEVMRREMNEVISDKEAEMMIKEADLEGKGKVNFEEFCQMMVCCEE